LSAPFRSRGFRWNFLPALARSFVARSRPISASSRDGACPVSRCRERTRTSEEHAVEEHNLETRFRKKHAGKKHTGKAGKEDYRGFHQRQETA